MCQEKEPVEPLAVLILFPIWLAFVCGITWLLTHIVKWVWNGQ